MYAVVVKAMSWGDNNGQLITQNLKSPIKSDVAWLSNQSEQIKKIDNLHYIRFHARSFT